MLYSSGTTGRPKGVKPTAAGRRPSARRLRARPRSSSGLFGIDADSVYLSPAPLYHAAPLRCSMTMQRLGGTVVVMERFDPERGARAHRAATASPTASGCRRCSSAC